jgi:hypothetical protein
MSLLVGRHDWFYYTSTKCAIPDDIFASNLTYDVQMVLLILNIVFDSITHETFHIT